jgi:endo-1,4-beta-xylanase
MNRWKGKIYAWDVANEVLNENGSLRSSVFYNVLGENFVRIAFTQARSADPNAKLYINDYGYVPLLFTLKFATTQCSHWSYSLDSTNAKVNELVRLVGRINSGTKLIDGIGTQAHLPAGGAGGFQAALQALAATGLEVAITYVMNRCLHSQLFR